jgi:hypothetical protein
MMDELSFRSVVLSGLSRCQQYLADNLNNDETVNSAIEALRSDSLLIHSTLSSLSDSVGVLSSSVSSMSSTLSGVCSSMSSMQTNISSLASSMSSLSTTVGSQGSAISSMQSSFSSLSSTVASQGSAISSMQSSFSSLSSTVSGIESIVYSLSGMIGGCFNDPVATIVISETASGVVKRDMTMRGYPHRVARGTTMWETSINIIDGFPSGVNDATDATRMTLPAMIGCRITAVTGMLSMNCQGYVGRQWHGCTWDGSYWNFVDSGLGRFAFVVGEIYRMSGIINITYTDVTPGSVVTSNDKILVPCDKDKNKCEGSLVFDFAGNHGRVINAQTIINAVRKANGQCGNTTSSSSSSH